MNKKQLLLLTIAAIKAGKGDGAMHLLNAAVTWNMDPDLIKQAIEALKTGDGDAALGILEGMIASAAGASEEPPAEEMAVDEEEMPVEEMAVDGEADEEEEEQASAALSRVVAKLAKAQGLKPAKGLKLPAKKRTAPKPAIDETTAKALIALSQKVDSFEKRTLSKDVESIIASNAGKLPNRELQTWAKSYGMKEGIEALSTVLKHMPTVETEDLRPPETAAVTLTKQHEELCKTLGTNPDYVKRVLARDTEVSR